MTRWSAAALAGPTRAPDTTIPLLADAEVVPVLPGHDVWDPWPVQDEDGTPATVDGGELWIALAAPSAGHPESRHDVARLRQFRVAGGAWTDLGPVLADGASPGSREWSGSTIRRADGGVSLFYTAAGFRGEPRATFVQRVLEVDLRLAGDPPRLRDTGAEHRELVRSGGPGYLPADERDGAPGTIRAFRDPGWFRDPATGRAHLLIAASVPDGAGFAGAVAIADQDAAGDWHIRPPLLTAAGVNQEIERPHVIVRDGRYHLFFSTHRQSFRGVAAPTGLYGFVAERLDGPYRPLNGSGLVAGNPAAAPDQTYAWLVLPDLRVASFVDYRTPAGRDGRVLDAAEARRAFGGTVAPELRLALDGDTARLVPAAAATIAERS